MKNKQDLDEEEQKQLEGLLSQSPSLKIAYELKEEL
jgi:hypothetical protein